MSKHKAYIGDAVYADWDGARVVLTTENGIEVTNRIVLEVEVLALFQVWARNTMLQNLLGKLEQADSEEPPR